MKDKHYTEEQIIWHLALGLKMGLSVGKSMLAPAKHDTENLLAT